MLRPMQDVAGQGIFLKHPSPLRKGRIVDYRAEIILGSRSWVNVNCALAVTRLLQVFPGLKFACLCLVSLTESFTEKSF